MNSGEDDAPLCEILFEINYQLFRLYPAFTPLTLDDCRFSEIIRLFAETRRMQQRENKRKDPNRVIRRKAGDDWF